MKFAVLQENLKKGLAIVAPAVSTRDTMPVLGNVALEASESGLKLSAMNLEMSISTYVGALVNEPGGVTLPFRLLKDLVGTLPKEWIDMELNGHTQVMRLTCGRTKAKINGIDLAEFPQLPAPKGEPTFTPSIWNLRCMIESVIHAAATDISRPTLTGVSMKIENQKLTAAASDGFRLAVRSQSMESFASAMALVPGRALAALAQVMNGEDDEEPAHVFIREDSAQVFFRLPGVDLATRTIDANYPDYMRIIPPKGKARYVLSVFYLERAVKSALMFADNDQVILSVVEAVPEVPAKLTLSVESVGNEKGHALTLIDLGAGSDDVGMEIAVNGDFLLQALAALDSTEVTLEFNDKGRPLVLRPLDSTDVVQVIMPMTAK